jgi:hypothetical protein
LKSAQIFLKPNQNLATKNWTKSHRERRLEGFLTPILHQISRNWTKMKGCKPVNFLNL